MLCGLDKATFRKSTARLHERAKDGDEFVGHDGLESDPIGAAFESVCFADLGAMSGEQYNRRLPTFGELANQGQRAQSVEDRHLHVENDGIEGRGLLLDGAHRFGSIFDTMGCKTPALEGDAKKLAHIFIIIGK